MVSPRLLVCPGPPLHGISLVLGPGDEAERYLHSKIGRGICSQHVPDKRALYVQYEGEALRVIPMHVDRALRHTWVCSECACRYQVPFAARSEYVVRNMGYAICRKCLRSSQEWHMHKGKAIRPLPVPGLPPETYIWGSALEVKPETAKRCGERVALWKGHAMRKGGVVTITCCLDKGHPQPHESKGGTRWDANGLVVPDAPISLLRARR